MTIPIDPKTRPSADEIYTQALEQLGFDNPPPAILRLLSQGLKALREADTEPLNEKEFFSINSMIAYVAHKQKVSEDLVVAILRVTFEVDDIKSLPSCSFPKAINFLVDLKMNKVIN
ncbi:MAG: hypothetical protein FWF24_05555 [Alphaproteobacteria bacterium]|nr:hypothetical protein [Alphaproteobacteria bacterium]